MIVRLLVCRTKSKASHSAEHRQEAGRSIECKMRMAKDVGDSQAWFVPFVERSSAVGVVCRGGSEVWAWLSGAREKSSRAMSDFGELGQTQMVVVHLSASQGRAA